MKHYTHSLQGFRVEIPQDLMSVLLLDGPVFTHEHTRDTWMIYQWIIYQYFS